MENMDSSHGKIRYLTAGKNGYLEKMDTPF